MRLGIVIVTHNSERVIGPCLNACRRVAPETPVVVVDNASQDETVLQVPPRTDVRLISTADNLGFAAAVNIGSAALDTDLVLLLNPDTELLTGLGAFIDVFQDPRVGAAGGLLLDDDGKPQSGFFVRRLPAPVTLAFEVLGLNRLWPANPVNRRYRELDLDPARPADVEQPAGAFLAFRRQAWESLHGFDESFFPIWFEDVDFCRRLRDAGWSIRFVPEVSALHAGGHSIPSMSWSARQLCWYGSLLKYTARHFRPMDRGMVCGAVVLAAMVRAVTGTLQRRSTQPLVVYGRVIRLAVLSLVRGWASPPGAAAGSASNRSRPNMR